MFETVSFLIFLKNKFYYSFSLIISRCHFLEQSILSQAALMHCENALHSCVPRCFSINKLAEEIFHLKRFSHWGKGFYTVFHFFQEKELILLLLKEKFFLNLYFSFRGDICKQCSRIRSRPCPSPTTNLFLKINISIFSSDMVCLHFTFS